jgi:hypothetical protein
MPDDKTTIDDSDLEFKAPDPAPSEVTDEQISINDNVEQELELPVKFQGKTPTEIVQSYQELESAFGKQGKELGEYRQLADKFLQDKLNSSTTPQSPAPVAEKELDFYEAPEDAVNSIVEKRVSKTEAQLAEARRLLLANALEKQFPTYVEDVNDSAFQNWVGESRYRTELYQRANHNYDADAAVEIFDLWNQLKPKQKVEQEMSEIDKDAEKQTRINKMTTEGGQTTGQSAGKIYSRKELIRLRTTEPERYERLAPLIRKAYEDGRVRD